MRRAGALSDEFAHLLGRPWAARAASINITVVGLLYFRRPSAPASARKASYAMIAGLGRRQRTAIETLFACVGVAGIQQTL